VTPFRDDDHGAPVLLQLRVGNFATVHLGWPCQITRTLLAEGCNAGVFAIDNTTESTTDAANAVLGALLLAVLGRSIGVHRGYLAAVDPCRWSRKRVSATVRGTCVSVYSRWNV
jgi:hypothetical protein